MHENDVSGLEPRGDRELTEDEDREDSLYEYRSPHSPFGTLHEIASCMNMKLHEILHSMPWQAVIMMMLDRGRTVKKKTGRAKEIATEEEANVFLSNTKGYRK